MKPLSVEDGMEIGQVKQALLATYPEMEVLPVVHAGHFGDKPYWEVFADKSDDAKTLGIGASWTAAVIDAYKRLPEIPHTKGVEDGMSDEQDFVHKEGCPCIDGDPTDPCSKDCGFCTCVAQPAVPVEERTATPLFNDPAHMIGAILDRIDMAPNDDPIPYIREYVDGLRERYCLAERPMQTPMPEERTAEMPKSTGDAAERSLTDAIIEAIAALPELPDLDCTPEEIAAGQEYADACGDHELRPFVAIKNANYRCRNRQLLTTLASLAQSEAERERLQEAYEQSTYLLGMRVIETATLRAELAREREANQGLREVVKEYREFHINSRRPCVESATCSTCQEADALLEPKAESVATTS